MSQRIWMWGWVMLCLNTSITSPAFLALPCLHHCSLYTCTNNLMYSRTSYYCGSSKEWCCNKFKSNFQKCEETYICMDSSAKNYRNWCRDSSVYKDYSLTIQRLSLALICFGQNGSWLYTTQSATVLTSLYICWWYFENWVHTASKSTFSHHTITRKVLVLRHYAPVQRLSNSWSLKITAPHKSVHQQTNR